MKKLLILLVLSSISFGLLAQKRSVKKEIDQKDLVYKNEFSVGIKLLSNSWSIFGERAKILSIWKTRFFDFAFMEYKNYKQTKQQPVDYYNISSFLDSNKDYFFGKQNNFYVIHLGYGYKKRIADKADKNGVRLSMTYLGGFSLGLTKPYYLEYIDSTYVEENVTTYIIVNERYSEENADKFLDESLITSASGFSLGLREIKPIPGVYGKIGLNFDWASNDQFVKALEVGVNLDVYYKRVPIMVGSDHNKPYFLGAYLSFQMGKRW